MTKKSKAPKTVQIPSDTHSLLVRFCRERGIKVGHFVATIIEKAIKTN